MDSGVLARIFGFLVFVGCVSYWLWIYLKKKRERERERNAQLIQQQQEGVAPPSAIPQPPPYYPSVQYSGGANPEGHPPPAYPQNQTINPGVPYPRQQPGLPPPDIGTFHPQSQTEPNFPPPGGSYPLPPPTGYPLPPPPAYAP